MHKLPLLPSINYHGFSPIPSESHAKLNLSTTAPARLQGPFKSPEEVQRLKSKPTNTTLRTQTDINSARIAFLEEQKKEWRERLIDDPFMPPSQRKSTPPVRHAFYSCPHFGGLISAAILF
jgi:hypothetical protein